MPLSPLQLYRAIVVGELHGQLTQTIFHFRGATSSPASTVSAEMNNLYADLTANLVPAMKTPLNQEWHAKSLKLLRISAEPMEMIDSALTGEGLQTGHSLPSFVAALLSLRTGFSDRSRTGRLYLPGIAEDLSESSRLEGSYLGLFQSFGTLLVNRYGASGTSNNGRLGVFSRKLGVTRVASVPPRLAYSTVGWTQVTQIIAQVELASCRKRKLRRGE